MKSFNLTALCVVLASGFFFHCGSDAGEMNQKTITALPSNQKSGLPEVSSIQPVDAATSISLTTTIAIAFGTKVNVATVETNFSVRRISDNSLIAGTFAWNQGTSFIFTPAASLDYNTNYRITISGKTAVGNDLVPYTSTFKTANDGTTPTVLSAGPANGVAAGAIVVSINWSEAMNQSIAAMNCTYDGLACNGANLSWTGNTMNYSEAVACGQSHTLALTYVEDITGTPSSYTKSFATTPCCTWQNVCFDSAPSPSCPVGGSDGCCDMRSVCQ